jgi:hypothetical protein
MWWRKVKKQLSKTAIKASILIIGFPLQLYTWYIFYWVILGVTEGQMTQIDKYFALPPGSLVRFYRL